MANITINGTRIHYLDHGTGEDVTFLHGLGGNCHEWDRQIENFSDRFRVIVPDLKGHGLSDLPMAPIYTPFDHASDLVALWDALGIEKSWVVGLSMGGFVALALAVAHPKRLKGIVLTSTSPYVDKDSKEVGERWIQIFQTEGINAYLTRVMKDLFTLDFYLNDREEVERFIESQKHRNLAGIVPSANGNNTFDIRAELSGIRLPTLIVHGLNDRVINPAHARRMRQAIPGAEVRLFTDTGHVVNVERAREFNQTVIEFLSRKRGQHAQT
jgi:pimeloyl-ACP methyl ester carboxylesterase